MMTGICVEPPPKALLAYWGYGDVVGPWYTGPSEHDRKLPLVSEQEALNVVGAAVRTGARGQERHKYQWHPRLPRRHGGCRGAGGSLGADFGKHSVDVEQDVRKVESFTVDLLAVSNAATLINRDG